MAPRFLSVFLIVGLLFPSFSIASEPAEIHEGIVEIPFVALILKPSDPLIFAALYQLSETELFVLCGADEGIISCWDSNHLMSLVVNSLSYDAYDPQGVRKSATYDDGLNPAVTTAYPTQYFNTDGTTIKEHIVVNGIPVATVERVGTGNPTIFWNSQDHLRSTSVVTDANAGIAESVEYFAFGSIKSNTGAHKEQRKYTGHEFDILSKYTYAQSRYLDTKVGRFLSEDEVFLAIGGAGLSRKIRGSAFDTGYSNVDEREALEAILKNPQALNSYSYVLNNPLRYVDRSGEAVWDLGLGFAVGPFGIGFGIQYEPGVGFQHYVSFNIGLSAGVSLKYDPKGTLDAPNDLGYFESEVVIVPGVGGYVTTQTDLSQGTILTTRPEVSGGFAVVAELGVSVSVVHYSPIRSISSRNNQLNRSVVNSSYSYQQSLQNIALQLSAIQSILDALKAQLSLYTNS